MNKMAPLSVTNGTVERYLSHLVETSLTFLGVRH